MWQKPRKSSGHTGARDLPESYTRKVPVYSHYSDSAWKINTLSSATFLAWLRECQTALEVSLNTGLHQLKMTWEASETLWRSGGGRWYKQSCARFKVKGQEERQPRQMALSVSQWTREGWLSACVVQERLHFLYTSLISHEHYPISQYTNPKYCAVQM